MAKKKKKEKKPNIPVQSLARPRLEQILTRRQQHELDDEQCIASIERLLKEIGSEAVLNALVGLLDSADPGRKETLMVIIPKLGNQQTIQYLWQLVRRSKMSAGSKMTALIILKQMGEEVDLENPGEYFSWRDLKRADIAEIANMGRFSMRAIIKELQQTKNIDEVEAMMLQFEKITSQVGGEASAKMMIEDLVEMRDAGAADMLAAIAATTTQAGVRAAARQGLSKLSTQKVFPQTEPIKSIFEDRFYAAYSTDPAHPWQQQVSILFERGPNQVQALVFLLDFGYPWQGAIKDMFPTRPMTPHQFQQEFLAKAARQGVVSRQVPYARARQFILEAFKANQKNRVKLPPECEEFRYLIDRRIVDPSPATLAYAAQVDARTVDEWGEMEGEPIRGMEIIDLDGQPMPVVVLGDPNDMEWVDEPLTFDDLLAEVSDYYELDEGDGDDVEETERAIPYDWIVDYLETRYHQNISADELAARWDNLCDFMLYLAEGDEAPLTLIDIQGRNLSEFITDFWDEEIEFDIETPLEEKQHAIETIRDLYVYLAEQGHIPGESGRSIAEAAAALFRRPGKLTPIP